MGIFTFSQNASVCGCYTDTQRKSVKVLMETFHKQGFCANAKSDCFNQIVAFVWEIKSQRKQMFLLQCHATNISAYIPVCIRHFVHYDRLVMKDTKVGETSKWENCFVWISQFVQKASNGENLINYLEPGVEYCVTAIAVTSFKNLALPSDPQCTYTSPQPLNTGTAQFLSLYISIFLSFFFYLIKVFKL